MLYLHNLTGILETAVRATNAQYDDPDILKRLDVRTLESSPGESGWDVFSLDYHVDGPIRTVSYVLTLVGRSPLARIFRTFMSGDLTNDLYIKKPDQILVLGEL